MQRQICELLDDTVLNLEFSWEDFEALSGVTSLHEFPAGKFVFNERDRGDFLAFLVAGEVTVWKESEDRLEKAVTDLRKGAVFGEMSFFDGEPRSASALAKTDVKVLFLSRESFMRLAREHPDLGVRLLLSLAKSLSRRLRQTTGRFVRYLA